VTDARNFLLNSDYPLDKVIYRASGSFALGAYFSTESLSIPHGLSFTPLPVLQWSTSSDFSVVYEAGTGPPPDDIILGFLGIAMNCTADGTNINIDVTNFKSTAYTIYYRVFGLMPSDENEEATSTQDAGDSFVLNTDQNYAKLIDSGKLTLSTTTTVTHGLGYEPQVFMWIEDSGIIYTPFTALNSSKTGSTLTPAAQRGYRVTTSQIEFKSLSPSYAYGHYRIYADE
jgi:hypothetical protein